jgi:hypothetical protein
LDPFVILIFTLKKKTSKKFKQPMSLSLERKLDEKEEWFPLLFTLSLSNFSNSLKQRVIFCEEVPLTLWTTFTTHNLLSTFITALMKGSIESKAMFSSSVKIRERPLGSNFFMMEVESIIQLCTLLRLLTLESSKMGSKKVVIGTGVLMKRKKSAIQDILMKSEIGRTISNATGSLSDIRSFVESMSMFGLKLPKHGKVVNNIKAIDGFRSRDYLVFKKFNFRAMIPEGDLRKYEVYYSDKHFEEGGCLAYMNASELSANITDNQLALIDDVMSIKKYANPDDVKVSTNFVTFTIQAVKTKNEQQLKYLRNLTP